MSESKDIDQNDKETTETVNTEENTVKKNSKYHIKRKLLIGLILMVALIVAAVSWSLFLRDDGPESTSQSTQEETETKTDQVKKKRVSENFEYNGVTVSFDVPDDWGSTVIEHGDVDDWEVLAASQPEYGIFAISNADGIGSSCYYGINEDGSGNENYEPPFNATYTLIESINTETPGLVFNRYEITTDSDYELPVDSEGDFVFSENLVQLSNYYFSVIKSESKLLDDASYPSGFADLSIDESYTHSYSSDENCYPLEGPNGIYLKDSALSVVVREYEEDLIEADLFRPANDIPAENINEEIKNILSSLKITKLSTEN